MTSQAVTSITTGITVQLCCHNRENIDVTGVLCLPCMKEHPRPDPERNKVETPWPHLPVLLSAPLHQTSAVL